MNDKVVDGSGAGPITHLFEVAITSFGKDEQTKESTSVFLAEAVYLAFGKNASVDYIGRESG